VRDAPTIYEVARAAGVSIATVSRALSDASKLKPETRDRVLRTVAELGYVPSGPAQGMATRRTGVLGLAFPDLADPGVDEGHETLLYYDAVLRGVERAARRAGYAVLIVATEGTEDLDLSLVGKTDGMVVLARTVSPRVLERLARRVPLVLCAGPREPRGLDHAGVANAAGTVAVTRHLIRMHGHRELAFLGGPADSPDAAARFDGFRRTLAEAGLPVPERPALSADFTESGGATAVAACLRAGQRPRALVCANDQMAVGALAALAGAGLEVPAEVAVTGFDDVQLARHVWPPLTTVRQPMRQLGTAAAELLLRRMAEPEAPPRAVTLATKLMVRASCGCPGAGGPGGSPARPRPGTSRGKQSRA
jgi:LacI family transcriptional regulator